MLKELRLSNFRLFDDEVTVRFRPITVLIGRNNSGKSSIIKFLLMLKKSLDKESAHFFNTEKTGLGNFTDIKNSLTEKENLFFRLTVNMNKSLGDTLLTYIKKKTNQEDVNEIIKSCHFATLAEIPYHVTQKTIKKHEAIFLYNEKEQLVRSKYYLEHANLLDFSEEWKEEQTIRNKYVHGISDLPKKKPEDLLNLEHQQSAEKQVIDILYDNINNLRHLLPVRGDEKSIIIVRDPPFIHVGQDGKYTLAHLQKIENSNKDKYDFICRYIKEVAGIDEIDFKKSESSDTSECFATNRLTKAKTLIGNFGFGVSQCLPIFVQGALMPAHSSLMVEQPEVQLHPTAQLELGSFFKDLWNKYKVGSIIETHSENILLRLRRLIAKEELQPEDVSIVFFDFDKDRKQPIIKNLNITKNGSIEEGLSSEFFGANLEEVLKIGAGE